MKADVKDYEKLSYLSAPSWDERTGEISWNECQWTETGYQTKRYVLTVGQEKKERRDILLENLSALADGEVKEYAVSPDGKKLAYITAKEVEKEIVPAGWKAPIVAEGGSYRKDADGGWKIARDWNIFVCDLKENAESCDGDLSAVLSPVCLFESKTAVHALCWLPDGSGVVFENGTYCAVNLSGEKICLSEKVVPALGDAGICCMPNGKMVLAAGIKGSEDAVGYDLFLLASDGSGELPVTWAGDIPDEVLPQMINEPPFSGGNRKICRTDLEHTVAVIGSKKGRIAVYLLKIEEEEGKTEGKSEGNIKECYVGTWKSLTDGSGSYSAICPGEAGYLYALRSDWKHPSQLVKISMSDGSIQVMYDANAWIQEKEFTVVSEYQCRTLDGADTLDGWVFEPANRKEEKVPAVLLIHGGPLSAWVDAFTLEVELLAASGIGVILMNPRGSSGYGKKFASYEDAFDGTAAGDLLYYMDNVLRVYPWIDGERLGVAGGSYGGYMSAWLAGHCKRFKAAVVMRGLLNFEFMYFTSQAAGNPGMFDEPVAFEDFLMKQTLDSPNTYAQEMDIPMLIMHGEKDVNCPLDGAHQLYVAVKDTHPDLPVRLIIFPGVGHNIRTARMDYYQRYETELVNWMKKYL